MKILIVDDNPHVLALIQQTLQSHGDVEAFYNAADALTRASVEPPDLVVTDYRLKGGMDGRELVEGLHARSETREVPVILLASKADIAEELHTISDQVEDFVTKPFFARDLASRAKRTLDKVYINKKQKEVAAAGGSAIRGKLSEMNIMDLFQAMEMGAKSCLLSLTNGQDNAQIYFGDGQVYHCLSTGVSGNLAGDEVVNRVVKWPDGQFEINFSAPRLEESNSKTGTQGLLMEAMRLMDEENK